MTVVEDSKYKSGDKQKARPLSETGLLGSGWN
jgi:hypothetical protein